MKPATNLRALAREIGKDIPEPHGERCAEVVIEALGRRWREMDKPTDYSRAFDEFRYVKTYAGLRSTKPKPAARKPAKRKGRK